MPIDPTGDPTGDPWPQTPPDTPSGAPGREPGAAAAGRQAPSLVLVLAGVAGALVLGVLFGLWARPELAVSPSDMPVAQAPTLGPPPDAAQVPLVVAPPAQQEPPPRAPGRLETLPPDMADAARIQAPPPDALAPAEAAPPLAADAPTAPQAAPSPPAPRYATSFDCATARPGAEEMVCADPGLAAADRRMARAYDRAMRSGVDPDDLRQGQRDWTAIREDAAMHSRQALAQVYDQRIAELNDIARSAPAGDQPQ